MSRVLGIDVGGTFTDCILIDEEGEMQVAKVPTTPADLSDGVMDGWAKLGVTATDLGRFVHGTTAATNALIERTGAKLAHITTMGMRDIIEIGRGDRTDIYNFQWDPPPPLVLRKDIFEVTERLRWDGSVLTPFDEEQARQVAQIIKERGYEAVSITFLHSYVKSSHEQRMKEILQEVCPDILVSISSDILQQYREYERSSTTMCNAYLMPVMQRYLENLERKIHAAGYERDLLLMQSSWGLMTFSACQDLPARIVHSGPAGGVVAAARICELKGLDAITMDMGGTSTDVALIQDGQPKWTSQLEWEWGLPIRFPSVDLLSVGAGGGSLAWIDVGGSLKVGPKSAGAVPGPVCYGRGGTEPTVTDALVVLGWLNAEYLLEGDMALQPEAARVAIEDKVARPLGMGLEEAARGILRINLDTTMHVIRKMTVDRGHDPREFALIAFGGCGGMFAAELARELSIAQIIIPYRPGTMSAVGLALGDQVYELSRAFLVEQAKLDFAAIEKAFSDMQRELHTMLEEAGVPSTKRTFTYHLDLRYSDQAYEMSVPLHSRPFDQDSFHQAAESFHQAHEREHGYRDESIPLEVVFIRVFAEGAIDKPRLKKHALSSNAVQAAQRAQEAQVATRQVWFLYSPTPLATAIYKRELLTAGAILEGPAIVEQLDATTLILPGMRAEVDEHLNLVITTRVNEDRVGVDTSQMIGEDKPDPILTEVIRNAFESVANEMSSTLKRSAMSLVINEYEDYSGVLSDGDGNIVRHGDRDLPVHSGSMQFSVQKIIKDIGTENFRPGDVYILNDPYEGGTHKHDVRVVAPAFFEGEIVGYLTTSGHWPDIGGAVPGSFYNQATDYYQEGLMIPPALIYREGKFNEDVERIILANLRQPKVTRGDLRAMISAVKCGESRLIELVKKYGKDTIQRMMKEYQEYSEKTLRGIVSGLPDGRYEWEDYIDQDPATQEKEPKKVKLALIIHGDQLSFDLTGTDSAIGPINGSLSGTTSIILAMINGIFNEVPFNYGVIKSINVTAPENTLVNAKSPAPIEGMSMTFDILTSTIMGAFSHVVPDRVIACMGGVTNILWGAWNPHHEPPRYFVAYVAIEIGWGGRATKDGLQGRLLFIGGGIRNIPIELAEKEYCVVVEQVAMRQDSEGAGKFRGGCGYQRIMRVEEDVALSSISDREKFAPFGLFDGESSTVATVILNPDTREEKDIGLYFSNTLVQKGARVKMMTSGGGGYGPPLDRKPASVLQDVLHGYISPKRAQETYGVVLRQVQETAVTQTYTIDAEATQALRGKLRQ